MLKCKSPNCNRGFVIIYTLFVGIIILCLILAMYKLAIYKDITLSEKAKMFNSEEEKNKEKENIFNEIYLALKNNGALSSKVEALNYISRNYSAANNYYGNSNFRFDESKSLIRLEYKEGIYEDSVQYYDITVSSGKMDFIFKYVKE